MGRMGEKENLCWFLMWVVKGIAYMTVLDLDGNYNIKIYRMGQNNLPKF